MEPAIAEAIDDVLSDSEGRDVNDGNDAYYGGTLLEHIDAYPGEFMNTWLLFEERLKHEVRFFDDEGKRLLDELFADLPSLAEGKAIVTIEPGGEFSTFYRARIANNNSEIEACIKDPPRNIGPPPPHLARAGRMNPAGIPAFYGAFSEDVAIAEVRPPVGAIVAVGKFILLRPLRLLDVSFLPFAYHKESIFSPAYDRVRSKITFLEKFHRRISRPVLPSDEVLAYLPTQAVAAYIANVMGLDGMIYGSIQIGAESQYGEQVERGVCNVALFGPAARIEGVYLRPDPIGDLEPLWSLPDLGGTPIQIAVTSPPLTTALGGDRIEAAPSSTSEGTTEDAHVAPNEVLPTATAILNPGTLRASPKPTLVKIRSVRVETLAMFTHFFEGRLILDDGNDDD